MFDISKNFSKLVVSGNYDASATSVLISGSNLLSKIPASGSGIFSAVWYNATDYPSVYNDPNKEIVRVTGLSGNTFFVDRGREYTSPSLHSGTNKVHKMIVTPTARGFNNLYYFRNPEKSYYMFEDFLGSLGSIEGWVATTSSSAGTTIPYSSNQQFGVWSLSSQSGAGFIALTYGLSAYLLGSGLTIFESLFSLNQIPSTGDAMFYRVGLSNSNSSALPANAVTFLMSSGSTFLELQVTRGSVETKTTTSIPLSTGWHKYNIVINQSGNKADFYIDDILAGIISGNNILPSAATNLNIIGARSAGINPFSPRGSGYVDYVSLYKEIQPITAAYGVTGYNYRL